MYKKKLLERYLKYFFITALLFFAAGCSELMVTPEQELMRRDVASLKNDVASLKEGALKLEKELISSRAALRNSSVKTVETVSPLKKEVEFVKNNSLKLEKDLRSNQAELRNAIIEVREDLSMLKGRFEEDRFDSKTLQDKIDEIDKGLKSQDEGLSETVLKVDEIQQAISETDKQLKLLEEKVVLLDKGIKKLQEARTAPPDVAKPVKTGAPVKQEDIYLEAYQLLKGKKYDLSLKKFNDFLKDSPDSELADNAQYWIGEIYYAQGNFEKAILEFNKVVKKYPEKEKVPAAYIKQALSFYNIGDRPEAKLLLERVKERYPNTDDAKTAEKKLKELFKENMDTKKEKTKKP